MWLLLIRLWSPAGRRGEERRGVWSWNGRLIFSFSLLSFQLAFSLINMQPASSPRIPPPSRGGGSSYPSASWTVVPERQGGRLRMKEKTPSLCLSSPLFDSDTVHQNDPSSSLCYLFLSVSIFTFLSISPSLRWFKNIDENLCCHSVHLLTLSLSLLIHPSILSERALDPFSRSSSHIYLSFIPLLSLHLCSSHSPCILDKILHV